MRAILPLALLAVVGCYSPRPVEPTPSSWSYGGGYGADAGPDAGPLEATVYYDEYSGYASFNVSRDAHVSLFLLRPGAGLEMIYPAIGYGTGTSFRQGRHMVRTASAFHRTSRTSVWDNDMWGRDFENGPMYVLLVASDEPLEVNQFLATRTMGWLRHSSVTYSPFLALRLDQGRLVMTIDSDTLSVVPLGSGARETDCLRQEQPGVAEQGAVGGPPDRRGEDSGQERSDHASGAMRGEHVERAVCRARDPAADEQRCGDDRLENGEEQEQAHEHFLGDAAV